MQDLLSLSVGQMILGFVSLGIVSQAGFSVVADSFCTWFFGSLVSRIFRGCWLYRVLGGHQSSTDFRGCWLQGYWGSSVKQGLQGLLTLQGSWAISQAKPSGVADCLGFLGVSSVKQDLQVLLTVQGSNSVWPWDVLEWAQESLWLQKQFLNTS